MKLVAVALASASLIGGGVLAAPVTAVQPAAPATFTAVSDSSAELSVERDGRIETIEITTLDEALALMADTRLTSLWPQIAAWAGPDFERLRANTLKSARAVFAKGKTNRADTGLASTVRKKLRPTFLLTEALKDTGHDDEAVRLMERARGTAPTKGGFGANEWAATSIWLSDARFRAGDTAGALAVLDTSIPPIADSRSRLNLDINRVVLLLFADRPAEALTVLDQVRGAFDAPGGDGPFTLDTRVRGSDRQFAWMRACALRKLGRPNDAAAVAALLMSGDEPREKRFIIDPTVEIRQTLALCSGDVAEAAQAYADALTDEAFGGDALLALQPAYRHPAVDPAFMERVRRHPTLAPVLEGRMRTLPAALTPALNGWRTMPAAEREAAGFAVEREY